MNRLPSSGSGTCQDDVRRAVAQNPCLDVCEVEPARDAGALAREGARVLVSCDADGTVSAVAAEHDRPLVVVPCGTRNHFATDCGADVVNPVRRLAALEGGVETRADVGTVNGRLFLDNVSIEFYAAMVRDPDYRKRRSRVAARYARRGLLPGARRVSLHTPVPPRVTAPEQVLVVLVSNNASSPGVAPRSALRPAWTREHRGSTCWVFRGTGRPSTERLLRGAGRLVRGRAMVAARATVPQTMTTDSPPISVGIDGEGTEHGTPLDYAMLPGGLRLLQPSLEVPVERERSLHW